MLPRLQEAKNSLFQPGVSSRGMLQINWILFASSQLSMKCKCALLTHRCHPLSVSVQELIMPIKCQGSLNRCADCLCRMIYWSNTPVWSRQERTFCLLVIPILVISFHIWASLARINFFLPKNKMRIMLYRCKLNHSHCLVIISVSRDSTNHTLALVPLCPLDSQLPGEAQQAVAC